MTSPTLYRLIFKRNVINEFDVYEQHRCQERGCVWTDEEYTGNTCTPGHIDEVSNEYQDNLGEGIIDEVVVE